MLRVLLVLTLYANHCTSLIQEQTIPVNEEDTFKVLWRFKFAEGGTLNMDVHIDTKYSPYNNGSIQLFLCSGAQLEPLRETPAPEVCAEIPTKSIKCYQHVLVGKQTNLINWSFKQTALTTDWYHFLQLNCLKDRYILNVKITAINPGGEYLSLSEVPYVSMYFVVTIGWGILVFLWLINIFLYRVWNMKLQKAMLIIPSILVVLSFFKLLDWKYRSSTGLYSLPLIITVYFFECFNMAALFTVIILMAEGWSITRGNLSVSEMRKIGLLIFLLIIVQGTYLAFEAQSFLFLFVVVIYIFILRAIFHNIKDNMTLLRQQLHLLHASRIEINRTCPVLVKLKMFKQLQLILVVYICVEVISNLWASVFLDETPWAKDAIESIVSALTAIILGSIFRSRSFAPCYYRISDDIDEEKENKSSPENWTWEEMYARGLIWRPGMYQPKDLLESGALHRREKQRFVVQQPTFSTTAIARPISNRSFDFVPLPPLTESTQPLVMHSTAQPPALPPPTYNKTLAFESPKASMTNVIEISSTSLLRRQWSESLPDG